MYTPLHPAAGLGIPVEGNKFILGSPWRKNCQCISSCGNERTRTSNAQLFRLALYQLSYVTIIRSTGGRSNQLSYQGPKTPGKSRTCDLPLFHFKRSFGGDDGTRTRDLSRDRGALLPSELHHQFCFYRTITVGGHDGIRTRNLWIDNPAS
jgi:hypothetical protein